MTQPGIQIKKTEELSTRELFDLLKLRSDVFVAEQQCVYPDMDENDLKSHHFLLKNEAGLIGYARLFDDGGEWKVGRVVILQKERYKSYGTRLIDAILDFCRSQEPSLEITMSAQAYLSDYYQKSGFTPVGRMYLEDGIPHIKMIIKNR